MTLTEFLAWEAEQPERFEFVAGEPVSVEPSTQARSLLIVDIVSILKPALKGTGMRVLINFRVPLPSIREVRYPAVVIDAGPYIPDALEPSEPVAIIDVGRDRDWSALPQARYLSVNVGDDPEAVLTLVPMRTN